MRLFLALDLPGEVRQELGRLQQRLADGMAGWRWTRAEAIHLTLRFLGEVDPRELPPAVEGWRAAAAGSEPFRLRLEGLGCFPPRGRPRVLWVGIRDEPEGRLGPLADRIEEAARCAGFEPERRPFRPHLTLARGARGGRPQAPGGQGFTGSAVVDVLEVTLFESRLQPQGARYTALERFPLASTLGEGAGGET